MKPPPRKRSILKQESPEPVLVQSGKWQRFELMRLMTGLKKLSRSATEDQEVDYCALKELIKTRSLSEVQSMVNSLKDRVIYCASSTLEKRRREERKVKKPIEWWTHMSSSVAGTQEETINTAFAQMLIVSSMEPRTLKNCDPPRVHTANPDQSRPAGRTVPFRPMPRPAPGPGVRPSSSPAPPLKIVKTPPPTPMGPAGRLSAPSQVVQVPSSKVPATETQPGSKSEAKPGPSSSQTTVSGPPQPNSQTAVTPLPPVPGPASPSLNSAALHQTPQSISALPSSASSLSPAPQTHSSPLPLSSQATTLCTRFGRTSKYATENSPRVLGLKCVVDFEKIYRYLSSILKPDEECCLTPMEGAIVLDLLMSLPEELPKLDCNKLRKHLTQVYQTLSTPSDSNPSSDLFKDLQDGLSPGTKPPASLDPQQSPARSAETQSLGVTQQPHKASDTASNQEAEITGARPPLNPFMVPVELLKCREAQPKQP